MLLLETELLVAGDGFDSPRTVLERELLTVVASLRAADCLPEREDDDIISPLDIRPELSPLAFE